MQDDEIRNLVRGAVLKALGAGGDSSAVAKRRGAMGARKLVTEADVQGMAAGSELVVPTDALITPLARDIIRERGLKVVAQERASSPRSTSAGAAAAPTTPHAEAAPAEANPQKTVALGADHGGFALKEQLKKYLEEMGYTVLDCGTHGTEAVDYPDFAYAVARWVSEGRAARGIVVDGAGIGSCMAANKVPGVRAAMCYDLSTAVNSREHNNANVLTLGGGLIGTNLAQQIVKTWLSTDFGGGRHARRVDKIMAIEQRYLKK